MLQIYKIRNSARYPKPEGSEKLVGRASGPPLAGRRSKELHVSPPYTSLRPCDTNAARPKQELTPPAGVHAIPLRTATHPAVVAPRTGAATPGSGLAAPGLVRPKAFCRSRSDAPSAPSVYSLYTPECSVLLLWRSASIHAHGPCQSASETGKLTVSRPQALARGMSGCTTRR